MPAVSDQQAISHFSRRGSKFQRVHAQGAPYSSLEGFVVEMTSVPPILPDKCARDYLTLLVAALSAWKIS